MRHLSVTFPAIDPPDDSVYRSLVPHAPRRRASLYNLDVLDDGTTIELVHVEGDRDEVTAELDRRDNLLEYEIVASRDETQYIYQHVDQDEQLLDLLALLREHRLLIDFPITYGEHGVTVRVVGEEHDIQSVFDTLPTEVRSELRVERISDYVPEPHDLRALLSVRQREVLEAAVEAGYYAFPRRATIDDLADGLGISRSTASEHLRRIEARVLGALV